MEKLKNLVQLGCVEIRELAPEERNVYSPSSKKSLSCRATASKYVVPLELRLFFIKTDYKYAVPDGTVNENFFCQQNLAF